MVFILQGKLFQLPSQNVLITSGYGFKLKFLKKGFLILFFVLAYFSTPGFAQKKNRTATDTIKSIGENASPKPELEKKDIRLIAHLPDQVKETSGLMFFNGQLWTINDGGNQPELYRIDTLTGKVLRKVLVKQTTNTDWEGLAQDDSSVYIGDFGNNYGNRDNLQILKIAKTDLLNTNNDSVEAATIYFVYPDQTHFAHALNRNNFDCEAFFACNDSLHLFSKDWLDLQTRHYTIPAAPGRYFATVTEQFPVDGLITDADINAEGKVILLGYKNTGGKNWKCFCWLFSTFEGDHFFSGKALRLELGSAIRLGQTEGITFRNDFSAWLSAESISFEAIQFPAKLFRLDLKKVIEEQSEKSK